ncbi:unnamed protein product [Boreogadus saida]
MCKHRMPSPQPAEDICATAGIESKYTLNRRPDACQDVNRDRDVPSTTTTAAHSCTSARTPVRQKHDWFRDGEPTQKAVRSLPLSEEDDVLTTAQSTRSIVSYQSRPLASPIRPATSVSGFLLREGLLIHMPSAPPECRLTRSITTMRSDWGYPRLAHTGFPVPTPIRHIY